ncbi:MAG: 5-carboxymethyl-2-hydroxymuconate Delta-isomerase [Rickettsiales bacterium]
MPHLIVEITPKITKSVDILVSAMQQALIDAELFAENDLKIRVHVVHQLVKDQVPDCIHCQLHLMPGRSVPIRQKLAEGVRASIEAIKLGFPISFTIQIFEINKDTYIKSVIGC